MTTIWMKAMYELDLSHELDLNQTENVKSEDK